MKKNLLLSSLSVAVLALGAADARAESPADAIELPTYVVETTRYASAEEHVQRSLAELRAQANTPVVVNVELPGLKSPVAKVATSLRAVRLAKS